MRAAFDRAMVWTVDHRGVTFLLVLSITALSVVGYTHPEWVRSLWVAELSEAETEASRDSRPRRTVPNVDAVSLAGADAIIVVQSDRFFTPRGAKALRRVVAELEELDYVANVLWMDRVPVLNIFGLPEPLFPRSEASATRFQAARDKALQHPLVGSQLVSEDARTLLLLVRFDWNYVRSDEQCTTGLRETAEAAAASFSDLDLQFQVTGRIPAFLTAVQAQEANQLKYQLIGYGMILLMAVILFRGVRAVFIVALAPTVGVFWTLGILRFFDLQDNPFNDVILPVLLSLVGFTDGVHMMVQIRRLRAAGLPEREAARTALHHVGFACLLTSVTTAIGLGSLTLAHHDIVKEFGWCSVIGVTLMFTAVATIVPLICSTWIGRNIHRGHERSLIDRNLTRISGVIDWVLRRPRPIAWSGIALTLTLLGISLTLRPDERRANSLPEHSEAYQAMQHMDRTLGGLEFASVEVRWSDDVDDDSPEILQVTTELDDLLRAEPLLGRPLSIRNFIDALPGEGNPAERMSMLELLPPPLKRAYFTPERQLATVSFRVQDLGIAKYGPVFERIESQLREIESRHPRFTLALAGDAVWRWRNLYQIVVDLAASLGAAAFIILVVLALSYRSLRLGLIAVVPNTFPLVVTGTWLVLAGYPLELTSVCAFTVCLGIAVDDTIHFLTRFEEERRQTSDLHVAVRRAFTGVGVAMVMTTVVLVAGFSTVAFSDSHDHHIFAMMGCLTITFALLGDMIILPAILAVYGPPANAVAAARESVQD